MSVISSNASVSSPSYGCVHDDCALVSSANRESEQLVYRKKHVIVTSSEISSSLLLLPVALGSASVDICIVVLIRLYNSQFVTTHVRTHMHADSELAVSFFSLLYSNLLKRPMALGGQDGTRNGRVVAEVGRGRTSTSRSARAQALMEMLHHVLMIDMTPNCQQCVSTDD